MTKKTFRQNLQDNPASAFFGNGQTTETTETTEASEPAKTTLDGDAVTRAQELLAKQQAAQEAKLRLQEAVAEERRLREEARRALEREARRKLTKRYKSLNDTEDPRTRRLNLLCRPSLYARGAAFCESNKISFNHLIEVALDDYLTRQGVEGGSDLV